MTAERLRILQLIDHLGPGGAQELVLEILRRIDRKRFDIEVAYLFGLHQYAEEFRRLGTSVFCLGNAPYRTVSFVSLPLVWRLYQQMVGGRYDVVHVHLYVAALYGPVLARLAGGARVVVTVHAVRDQLPRYVLPLFRLAAPLVDAYIGDLEISREELLAARIPASKIGVIEIGTDLRQFTDGDVPIKDIRAEFSLPADATLLLNVGRFHPQKGQVNLIRAMRRVVVECPNAYLVLVGVGETETMLRREAARLGVTDHVVFAGFRRDLRDLLRSADLYVMAPDREALGVITIQALASARPVIATDVGAVSEAVIHGETGLLVPVGDQAALERAMVSLIRAPELRRTMGERGRRLAEARFSIEAFVAGYEKLYASIGVSAATCC